MGNCVSASARSEQVPVYLQVPSYDRFWCVWKHQVKVCLGVAAGAGKGGNPVNVDSKAGWGGWEAGRL